MQSNSAIIEALDIESYHSHPAIGSSGLREFMETPYNFYYKYILGKGKDKSPQCALGSAAHKLIIEGEESFKNSYIINEDFPDKRTKAYKEMAEQATAVGKTLMLKKEYDIIADMANELVSHKLACEIIKGARKECSYFAKVPGFESADGKARPDFSVIGDIIADYKTTSSSLKPDAFGRNFFKYGYHIQGQYHKMIMEQATGQSVKDVVYIAQQSSAPYLVRAYSMEAEHYEMALMQIQYYMPSLINCLRENIWPKYPESVSSIVMPKYYGTEVE